MSTRAAACSFRTAFAACTYDHFTTETRFHPALGEAFAWTAPDAYRFCVDAYRNSDLRPSAYDAVLSPPAFEERVLAEYRTLSASARADVLGWETLVLHEFTHHVDHLTTPAGLFFHLGLLEEYLALQQLLPVLYAAPKVDLTPPLRELLDQVSESLGDARGADPSVVDTLRYVDGMLRPSEREGVGPADITPGWPGSSGALLPLLGVSFAPVTVCGQPTVHEPGRPETRVRNTTIFEGRAVAHCLRFVLGRFATDPALAGTEAIRYLDTYYPVGGTLADYAYLLDLFAHAYGSLTFRQLLEQQRATERLIALEQVPSWLSTVTWYALHGPDPITRALLAIDASRRAFDTNRGTAQPTFGRPGDMLDYLERVIPIEHPIDARLQATADSAGRLRVKAQSVRDDALREHFGRIFAILEHQLRKRVGHGYRTPLGLPFNGNPFPALADDDLELGTAYDPPARVRQWFQLRDLLLYRRRDGDGCKRPAIAAWLEGRAAPLDA